MDALPQPASADMVLTPELCLRALLVQAGWAAFFVVLAVIGYATSSRVLSAVFGINALIRLPAVYRTWKMYVAVMGGAVVTVPKGVAATLPAVPALVSVIVVLALTAVVVAASFLSVMIWPRPQPVSWRPIIVAVNGGLWFFTLFCWYRLFTVQRKTSAAQPAEVDPGAWPPPPTARP